MRILLFKQQNTCYDSVNAMIDSMNAEFISRGIACDVIDVSQDREVVLAHMNIIEPNKYDAAIAINAVGQQNVTMGGDNLFDICNIPFFNILLDHPMEHYDNLKTTCRNYHIICLDRKHVSFIKRYFPNIAGVYFLPLAGGNADNTEIKEISERSMELVFAGSLLKYSCEELLEGYKKYPEPYNGLILRVIDRMISHGGEDISEAFSYIMYDDLGWNGTDEGFLDVLSEVQIANYFMRTFAREEILGMLLKMQFPIHLYGGGMERLLKRYPNNKAIYHGRIPFNQMPEVYSDARIVLNINPMFKDGCHDRIPTAMLYGAAVLTDSNCYTDEVLSDKLFSFANTDALAQELPQILEDEVTLNEIIIKGYEYAKSNMTWSKYVDELLRFIS